jgi:transcriptional activator of cad operon
MPPLKTKAEFGKWNINLDHYSMVSGSKEIFVEPRLLKLLHFLHIHSNKLVKRNELIDHVWGDVVVTEESLSKAVFDLRKFLTENFKDPPRITTVRKVGYRLELEEKTVVTNRYRALHLVAKAIGYVFIFAVLLSLIVRAMRYEN